MVIYSNKILFDRLSLFLGERGVKKPFRSFMTNCYDAHRMPATFSIRYLQNISILKSL